MDASTYNWAMKLQIGDYVQVGRKPTSRKGRGARIVAIRRGSLDRPRELTRRDSWDNNLRRVQTVTLRVSAGKFWKPCYRYDVRYADGKVEEDVQVERLRPLKAVHALSIEPLLVLKEDVVWNREQFGR